MRQNGTIEILFEAVTCPTIQTVVDVVKKELESKRYFTDINISILDGILEGYFKVEMNLCYEADYIRGCAGDYDSPAVADSFDVLTEDQITDIINKIATKVNGLNVDEVFLDIDTEETLLDRMEEEEYEAYEDAEELRGEQWRDEQRDGSYMY